MHPCVPGRRRVMCVRASYGGDASSVGGQRQRSLRPCALCGPLALAGDGVLPRLPSVALAHHDGMWRAGDSSFDSVVDSLVSVAVHEPSVARANAGIAACAVWSCVRCAGGGCEESKGIWWMPWRQEAMKDVARCEKPRGDASRSLIRGCPNGETHPFKGYRR